MTINFDPRSPDFRRNPYPYYDQLRQAAPIFFWEAWGVYFLTRHTDCSELLREERLPRDNVRRLVSVKEKRCRVSVAGTTPQRP